MPAGALVAAVCDGVVHEKDRDDQEDAAEHYKCANHRSILSSSQYYSVTHAPEPEDDASEANPWRKWTVSDKLTEQHACSREIRDVTRRLRDKKPVFV